ncbi:hypothetical protein PF010_g16872 [Phytophthora fragariae]|uniref:RxLR effector protein n=1 Tax=Phytophthora fragariae TaxID=53985 RepID=A0A6G0KPQ8_9STRA|nr:hypothetical protein PF010_g16872 [Phytophthora fragariae]KAE9211058.1 hypothetical protein PF004_g16025 [Phytophthora fragariae]
MTSLIRFSAFSSAILASDVVTADTLDSNVLLSRESAAALNSRIVCRYFTERSLATSSLWWLSCAISVSFRYAITPRDCWMASLESPTITRSVMARPSAAETQLFIPAYLVRWLRDKRWQRSLSSTPAASIISRSNSHSHYASPFSLSHRTRGRVRCMRSVVEHITDVGPNDRSLTLRMDRRPRRATRPNRRNSSIRLGAVDRGRQH